MLICSFYILGSGYCRSAASDVYFERRNNRARVIIFVVGWGPGCGVGGAGGSSLDINSSGGSPLLLLLSKAPPGPPTPQPGPQPDTKMRLPRKKTKKTVCSQEGTPPQKKRGFGTLNVERLLKKLNQDPSLTRK